MLLRIELLCLFLISFLYGRLSSLSSYIPYNCYITLDLTRTSFCTIARCRPGCVEWQTYYTHFCVRMCMQGFSHVLIFMRCTQPLTLEMTSPPVINSDIFIQLERPRFQIHLFLSRFVTMLSLDFLSPFIRRIEFFYDRVSKKEPDVPRGDISRSPFGKGYVWTIRRCDL